MRFTKQQVHVLVGPNGAGKTSLLKMLLGSEVPTSGEVLLGENSIESYTKRRLAKQLAWVPQVFETAFPLSVMEIVRMGLTPHKNAFARDSKTDNEHIHKAMSDCGVLDKRHQRYQTLSGGEQQRVLLARALLQNTPILLLDEPTSHLDVFYQHEILAKLRSLNKTVVLSMHDLNLAAQYADTITIMNKGKIVASGVPETALKQDTLQEVFGLNCDVALGGNRVPIVCFSK